MTTLFALGFCLALLSGFWLAARLGRRGWSPLAATLTGAAASVIAGAAVTMVALRVLRSAAETYIRTVVPDLTERAVELLSHYAQFKG